MQRLRTIAKTLIRNMDHKFNETQHTKYAEDFYLFMRILLREKNSANSKDLSEMSSIS